MFKFCIKISCILIKFWYIAVFNWPGTYNKDGVQIVTKSENNPNFAKFKKLKIEIFVYLLAGWSFFSALNNQHGIIPPLQGPFWALTSQKALQNFQENKSQFLVFFGNFVKFRTILELWQKSCVLSLFYVHGQLKTAINTGRKKTYKSTILVKLREAEISAKFWLLLKNAQKRC